MQELKDQNATKEAILAEKESVQSRQRLWLKRSAGVKWGMWNPKKKHRSATKSFVISFDNQVAIRNYSPYVKVFPYSIMLN